MSKRNTPERARARMLAWQTVPVAGKSCERCGRSDVRLQRHHTDYSKPLDVVILCPKCHAAEHAADCHAPATTRERDERIAGHYSAFLAGRLTRGQMYDLVEGEGTRSSYASAIYRKVQRARSVAA